jgi:hypothetical protein
MTTTSLITALDLNRVACNITRQDIDLKPIFEIGPTFCFKLLNVLSHKECEILINKFHCTTFNVVVPNQPRVDSVRKYSRQETNDNMFANVIFNRIK